MSKQTAAPCLRQIGVENYKAIRKGGMLRLSPLNVFIGNNGSGKSSWIEAARTYQRIMFDGVDAAFADVLGFEQVRNKHLLTSFKAFEHSSAIHLRVKAKFSQLLGEYDATLSVNSEKPGKRVFIATETVEMKNSLYFDRDSTESTLRLAKANPGKSVAREWLGAAPFLEFVERWQFVLLNPEVMGKPHARRSVGGRVSLAEDGSNVAEVLLDLMERSPSAFEEVVQAMTFVLPYAGGLRPQRANDLEQRVYLQFMEQASERRGYAVPSWLFSTGTLRVLAIITLLKDPDPPPVIFIEEIENGLDPRTVGLVVDLLREATGSGRTQVIATSHSPYLLDLLDLDDLILCQRDELGEPAYTRAGSDATLKAWREDFTPGRLYTMGRLQHIGKRLPRPSAPPAEPEAPEGGWDDSDGDGA